MRESTLENKLRTATKQRGGIALKFVSPGLVGVPDRLIIMPHGHYGFVEVKRPGAKPRPIQKIRIKQLQDMGCKVYILSHPNQITDILRKIADD